MISLDQLKERKLVQWAAAYVAAAWVVLQVLSVMHGFFGWPPALVRGITVLLVIGFFAVLVVAWYHGEKGEQRVSTVELGMLTGILVIAGGILALVGGDAKTEPVAASPPARSDAPAVVAEQGSIAVLPFVNMSGDEQNEYFSDGLSEELLNALSQLPELRVAARTSSFAFEGKGVGIDSIARALNVRHVLEGSVRKAGDQVRITAQLIDAETGYHLWSETYDRELADIFAVQDEISRAIVSALQIEMSGDREGAPLVREETSSPEAHTLVLRGDFAANLSTREGLAQAERLLKQALALDPEYARAHALLADVYHYQAYSHWIPSADGYAMAKSEAQRALEIDPSIADAHLVLGAVARDHDRDWEAAEAHFARALEINPGFARAHYHRAFLQIILGQTEEAIASARRALALDPVSLGALNNLGEMYRYARQPEQAIEQYRAALTLDPGHPIMLANIALTHAVEGRNTEAVRAAREAVAVAPEFGFALSTLGYVQARAGQQAEAEQVLAELEALPVVSPVELATVHAGLGNVDRMFTLLERSIEKREGYAIYLGVDPVFAPYRDDPRMRQLLDRMGLGDGNG